MHARVHTCKYEAAVIDQRFDLWQIPQIRVRVAVFDVISTRCRRTTSATRTAVLPGQIFCILTSRCERGQDTGLEAPYEASLADVMEAIIRFATLPPSLFSFDLSWIQ